MKIHSSRFEQTTALTDVFLGILSAYLAVQFIPLTGFKWDVWAWAFGLLAFSSLLGAAAHGFEMSQKINTRLWMPLNLSLGLVLGLFVVAALFDLSGEAVARSVLPFMIVAGFIFFLVTVFVPGTFMTFIAYEAAAMLFSLGVYGFLTFKGTLPGAGWMLAGVFVTIIAAVVQAVGRAGKSMLWNFDNNGMFHWIQMLGLALLAVGLKAAL
ncbi:MAG: hypothetical protein HY864_09065 [Chloroflexi bacterium]|nr:hypothetical protein [Chloroflexota bacterium]